MINALPSNAQHPGLCIVVSDKGRVHAWSNETGLARVAEEHGVEPKHRFNLRQLTGCWTGVDAAHQMSTTMGNTKARQVVKYGLQDWYQVRPRCPVLSRTLPLVESLMLLALSLPLTLSLTHSLILSLSHPLSHSHRCAGCDALTTRSVCLCLVPLPISAPRTPVSA
jgi:hypothetical protein